MLSAGTLPESSQQRLSHMSVGNLRDHFLISPKWGALEGHVGWQVGQDKTCYFTSYVYFYRYCPWQVILKFCFRE